ncbi:MAG: ABC transporter substrate-binding protein [Cellulomonas sp.]|nr:ABC transporter substrate-binding protein [Cellulomonas sp.]
MASHQPTRRLRVAVWAGAAVLSLAACSSGTSTSATSSAGPTTITFSYLWSGVEAESLEKIIAEFNASQDEIVVEGVSNPDTTAQLTAMSSSEGSFDISDHFGSSVGAYASKGILAPLDEFIEADGYDTSDFIPSVLDQMSYDGQYYSMPIAVHTQMLMYNKTLFAEAGIAEAPTTTEEWAQDIAALTKVDSTGAITQLGYGNMELDTDFTTLGFVFGGQWFDEDGTPTPDNEGNVAGLSFYVDNVPAAYGADAVTTFESGFGEIASAQNPFYTGQLATIIEGAWEVNLINQYAPDLDYGVAPIPYPEDQPELAGTTSVSSSTLFIPANSTHKEQAWEFMKYLLSSDAMAEFTHATSNLPSRPSLADDPIYDDLGDAFAVWLDSLTSDNIQAMASSPLASQYGEDRATAFEEIATQVTTPADALAQLASAAASYE